jgi:LysR family transcriptional regulator for metE and metH
VDLETRQLRMLVAIADEGTVTRAAATLNVSQPALSHGLRALEKSVGVSLFARRPRGLVPTEAGERLLRTARSVLREIERARTEIAGRAIGRGELLRLSTECYTAYHWLPAALTQFERRFPAVTVQVVVEATRRPLPALLEGSLDVAIVSTRSRNARIAYHGLFDDELVVVMAPAHRLVAAPFVAAEDLAAETLFMYPIPREDSDVFQRVLLPARVEPARLVPVELTEAILELVRAGRGVAVLARWAVAPDLGSGRLLARRLTRRGLRRRWFAATVARRPPAHMAEFISLVRRLGPGPRG